MTMPPEEPSVERVELVDEFDALLERIRTLLVRARVSCGPTDLRHAADMMGALTPGKFVPPEDARRGRMIYDLALFEPNDRGVRPFDRFLSGPARTLPEPEQDLAHRMGAGFYSLFRFTAKHEGGGMWVEDILDDDRRIWVMTPPMDGQASTPAFLAMRLFDSGPFHLPLSVALSASERLVRGCSAAKKAMGHLPFPRALAATIYGLTLMDGKPAHPSARRFARDFAAVANDFQAISGETARGA